MSEDRRDGKGRRVSDGKAVELPVPAPASKKAAPAGDPAVEAQLLAGGPKRGLKSGPETLDRARTTYLGTEYSGSKDRRPPKGRIAKTEV